jgi:cobalt-precorrin 5A hydrolase / precorrin-3B C17-methyltransferase
VTPAIVALTPGGAALGRRLAAAIGGELQQRGCAFSETAPHLRALFCEGRPIVGVCAAGIIVRALAPVLTDKRNEPPVVAVAEDGSSAVPLLGGHRGANDLARRIAGCLSGHAAITTAGDLALGVALDAPPAGWRLANPEDAAAIMAALLGGEPAELDGEAGWLRDSRVPFRDGAAIRLVATTRRVSGDSRTLVYHPARLALGVGCERGAEPAEVAALVDTVLAEAGLAAEAVACVVSLDLKADEPAVLALAERLGVPARFFPPDRLEAETPRLANPSEAVFREVGCHGVAEAGALAASGPAGRLVAPKRKSSRATCAVAEAAAPIDPATVGRGRGRLAVVGIGPGAGDWLTPEARRLIEASDALVGYSLYLDLTAGLAPRAERFAFPLGAEAARAEAALRLAGEGRDVALVSSGDPGIYAMASLVFELLERGTECSLPASARRVEIVVAPGISALQAAAARAGAPLGHDFCAISLSDLLTPWPAIEARIKAAAAADFAIAFYNPVSQRRRSQLAAAKAMLLAHRPAETPVVIARNLGRDGEAVSFTTLDALDPEGLDMLSIVLVGASTTARLSAGGRDWVYTPRGYGAKDDAP